MIALALAARMFVGYLYPYYALDWMPADEARPPPRTVLVRPGLQGAGWTTGLWPSGVG